MDNRYFKGIYVDNEVNFNIQDLCPFVCYNKNVFISVKKFKFPVID